MAMHANATHDCSLSCLFVSFSYTDVRLSLSSFLFLFYFF